MVNGCICIPLFYFNVQSMLQWCLIHPFTLTVTLAGCPANTRAHMHSHTHTHRRRSIRSNLELTSPSTLKEPPDYWTQHSAGLKCFLEVRRSRGAAAGPEPSGVESTCCRLYSQLLPPSLGTEAGSRQGKQADNQVGPGRG